MSNYNEYLEYLKSQTHATEALIKEKIAPLQSKINSLKAELSNIDKEKSEL